LVVDSCSVCGVALRLFSKPAGPVRCFRCHPANEALAEEKRKRVEAQRKKTEAETRKLYRQKGD
jgi:uncharacterized Zn finger protein (UPF0148 family)